MAYEHYICAFCSSQGKIEIGRNEDNKSENLETCPICHGKKYLTVNFTTYGPELEIFMKRFYGDDYGKYYHQ